MSLVHEVVSSVVAFKGRFLEVTRDQVRSLSGKVFNLEYIKHPGASVIIPVLEDGRLLLERQYRHAVKRVMLEFPAGKIDNGETPLRTAQRELSEETGYFSSRWDRLGVIHPCIGYSDEFIEVFLATGARQEAEPRLDHGEELETMLVTKEDLRARILRGEVTDAKTLSAFLLWTALEG